MHHVSTVFKGSFYEIGKQQGKIYQANEMNFNHVVIDNEIYRKQLKIYEEYYPEFLEELRGVAELMGCSAQKIVYNFISSEIDYYRNRFNLDKSCTIFGYKQNDRLYIGRNYDWIPAVAELFEVYKVENPQRNTFFAVTDFGVTSSERTDPKYRYFDPDDLINDKGLYIGVTFAYADQWSYGLSCTHMMKLIAETCETVNDAINVFNRVPLCCPKNFFIADKSGNMAVVEHTSKKFSVIYPKDNILIKTNHYIDHELAKEDTVLKHKPTHNTFLRYYETLRNINIKRDNFNLDTAIEILSKPGSYTLQNSVDWETVWSLTLEMTEGRYLIYSGLSGDKEFNELKMGE